jgi:serine/threonine-protein kinase
MSVLEKLEDGARARVGSILSGKYHLDGLLGTGSTTAVYSATHRNRKRFAIKILHPELAHFPEVRVRFLGEGYAANLVGHPGTVATLDDDEAEDGAPYLVMELLDGNGIEVLWARHRFRCPTSVVLAIGYQLLDILAAAHAEAIVHCDVNPSNLFVTKNGVLKLLDFGSARVREAAAANLARTRRRLVLGTPAFMAPEQALGKSGAIDALTDVWCAGATLFTLASGKAVHEAESPTKLVRRAGTAEARSLAEVLPRAKLPLVAAVDRALAFDKSERWPSAVAMRDGIAAAYKSVVGRNILPDE